MQGCWVEGGVDCKSNSFGATNIGTSHWTSFSLWCVCIDGKWMANAGRARSVSTRVRASQIGYFESLWYEWRFPSKLFFAWWSMGQFGGYNALRVLGNCVRTDCRLGERRQCAAKGGKTVVVWHLSSFECRWFSASGCPECCLTHYICRWTMDKFEEGFFWQLCKYSKKRTEVHNASLWVRW